MRIAMVAACPFPWPRGTPVRIHRMAEALTHRGHEVHVVTYHLGDRSAELLFPVHRIDDVPGYTDCRPGPTLRKLLQLDPLLVSKLKQVLSAHRFDVIHAHHYEGLLVALRASARRVRPLLVYDAHTLLASELPYYKLGLTRRLKIAIGRTLDERLPPCADHVIAVSEEIREVLRNRGRIADSAITIIRNGVEALHFSEPRARSEISVAGPRLVFAGNLAAYQGIDLLLQGFARVRHQLPGARLVIFTDSDFAPYESLARSLAIREAIEVSGTTYQALPGHLQSADVLMNPRVQCEGLPQKLMNYMAAGRPIVSFAGSARLLEHEHTALIAADDDLDAFAAAAIRLTSDPALGARLAANAQRLVVAEHGWNQVAVKVEGVYRALCRTAAGKGT